MTKTKMNCLKRIKSYFMKTSVKNRLLNSFRGPKRLKRKNLENTSIFTQQTRKRKSKRKKKKLTVRRPQLNAKNNSL